MVYGFDENLNKIDVKDKATQEGVDSGQDERLTALETDKQDTMSAGTGIALDGTTINHSNSVTAKTTYVGSAMKALMVKYDSQGHITATSTATMYPPTTVGTAGEIWTSDGSGVGNWQALDTAPTSGSTNAVTSGAVYSALGSYLPLSGGTVSNQIIITGSNPHLGLSDSSGAVAYFQTHDDGSGLKAGFGYGWVNSIRLDQSGNLYLSGSLSDGTNSISVANIQKKATISTSDPSGGSDGDIWYKYE